MKTIEQHASEINDLVSELEKTLEVNIVAVTLYGSQARGYAKENSDVDVAVLFTHLRHSILPPLNVKQIKFESNGNVYDINCKEVSAFCASLAAHDTHTMNMLYGRPVYNKRLLLEMREILMLYSRNRVAHTYSRSAMGTLRQNSKTDEGNVKQKITAAYSLLQAILRLEPAYDQREAVFPFTPDLLPEQQAAIQVLVGYTQRLAAGERYLMDGTELEATDDCARHVGVCAFKNIEPHVPLEIEPKWVLGDETLLTQAFTHLLVRERLRGKFR